MLQIAFDEGDVRGILERSLTICIRKHIIEIDLMVFLWLDVLVDLLAGEVGELPIEVPIGCQLVRRHEKQYMHT